VLCAERFDYPRTGAATEVAASAPAEPNARTTGERSPKHDPASFEQGIQQGRAHAQIELQQEARQLRRSVEGALEQFKKERETYFGFVENEIVHLALAIAKKILHREAQMDPLLLTGLVRVALEKLESGTKVRLHTNPEEILAWRDHFAQSERSPLAPELLGDPALQHGECYLETELGSTHISLDAQLKEIEQGFFDLLQRRPPVR